MNKITKQNGTLLVPDKVVIPFIEGDGVGAEITPVCQRIVDEAVGRAYGGQRVIEWKEVLAGEKDFKQTGSWLPDETSPSGKPSTSMSASVRYVGSVEL